MRCTLEPGERKRKMEIARRLRKSPTEAEKILWGRLRDSVPRFRRRSLVMGYIPSFWCPGANVVVEVVPKLPMVATERSLRLRAAGLEVVSISEPEILADHGAAAGAALLELVGSRL